MKRIQLINAGVPEGCVREAMASLGQVAQHGDKNDLRNISQTIKSIVASPEKYSSGTGSAWYRLGDALLREKRLAEQFAQHDPVKFAQWGTNLCPKALRQMYNACEIPIARKAAVMPDAHLGYGVPIGCVLATENAVIPNAVGVDIACRMKLTVLDIPWTLFASRNLPFRKVLTEETRFGPGSAFGHGDRSHPVMDDERWNAFKLLRGCREKAAAQLGSSGGGNHFVEFGYLRVEEFSKLGLEPGKYLALMSHSGSRRFGMDVAREYCRLAKARLPQSLKRFSDLAWLDMDSDLGEQYWLAMNLAGDYAAANHDCIHKSILKALTAESLVSIENHHNFAWKEIHDGKELIVHRKGATPAGQGMLGVIPGSMADPAFVVSGKGNTDSLESASHGAGRKMSRTVAKRTLDPDESFKYLKARGVELISAGMDEMPGAYNDILQVMDEQSDLVDKLARFDPKLVRMAGK